MTVCLAVGGTQPDRTCWQRTASSSLAGASKHGGRCRAGLSAQARRHTEARTHCLVSFHKRIFVKIIVGSVELAPTATSCSQRPRLSGARFFHFHFRLRESNVAAHLQSGCPRRWSWRRRPPPPAARSAAHPLSRRRAARAARTQACDHRPSRRKRQSPCAAG